ncbi:KPN_02809 family neutral zinc metallopeptidase [Parasphingorhabdus halotolerans]|uniref:Zinc metalloprotease n=1 Tax=Parasphingorhabdus halotolerans TaxID=2725558 RepID=A0A6H2DIT6_9SPHN|nr:neutral zinc metallopeptidase [Parasphingorhabdus halotolerans]QJB68589.1 zinc metalloprotease [Parasphingorhabdus halotolerans]
MRLDDLDPSKNARDHGSGGGRSFGGGGGGGLGLLLSFLPMLLGRKMGCGTMLLIGGAAAAFLYFGGGASMLGSGSGSLPSGSGSGTVYDTAEEQFAGRVLASTEQTWSKLFQQNGSQYKPTTINFYQGGVSSNGCGSASSASGPFYCPADQGIYLDTSFFDEMQTRMGAKGDFAQAYVIAHEVGHHIQNLSGVATQVRNQQQRASKAEGNALQVRMELQADCYAGVWAAQNASRMEPGDVEEGLNAAHAIGDDTLMRGAGQTPIESMFTHGTSEQRMAWLRKGMQTGDPASCDTFARGAVR